MTVASARPRTALAATAAALGGALALGACTTAAPVEVTRFHLPQPIAPASVVVQQGVPAGTAAPALLGPDSLETGTYNQIVAGQLTRLGFTQAPSIDRADLVASVTVDRGTREDLSARQSGFSFGLGGFGGGGGGFRRGGTAIGGGAGVTVPIGGNRPRYIIGTRLMVQLKRRSEGTVIWEGRAQTEARGQDPASQPNAAVQKLAAALFAGFPGESGRTITVR